MRAALATIVLALSTAPVYAVEFLGFEGKNSHFEGEGGTKKTVDGVDFWDDGSPPRKFKLLGYISDTRHKTGLIGKMKMRKLEGDVAKAAREAGGDAVILVSSGAETVGFVGNSNSHTNANAFSSGNSVYGNANTNRVTNTAAVQKQHSRYAVVKYLPEEGEASPVE